MAPLTFHPHIQRVGRFNSIGRSRTELEAELGMTVHQMCFNENPIGHSPKVSEAIQAAAQDLATYPAWSDITLREALVDVLGRGLTPDYFFSANSGSEVLELVTRAFLQVGDEYIISSPTFAAVYNRIGSWQGGVPIDVPLAPETFAYDVEGVLGAITEHTRLIMLCNPNNPTSTIIKADEMAHLMAHVPEHVVVVADEVYHHFVDDPDFPDSLQYVLDGKNIVIVHTFSKAYGLAGLRVGYGIARPELAHYIASLVKPAHLDKMSLAGAIAACQDQAHLQHVIEYIRNERLWLLAQLDRLDVRYWPAAGNFVLAQTRLPTQDLADRLRQRGVIIRPQNPDELPHAVRITVGMRDSNEAFINGLEAILQESS